MDVLQTNHFLPTSSTNYTSARKVYEFEDLTLSSTPSSIISFYVLLMEEVLSSE